MKIDVSRDGKITIIAENGADEFVLDRYLPINGGCRVEYWGREFVGIAERRLSVTLVPTTPHITNQSTRPVDVALDEQTQ